MDEEEKTPLDDGSLSLLDGLKKGSLNFCSGWWWAVVLRYMSAGNSIYKFVKKREIKILDVGGSAGNFIHFFTSYFQTPSRKKIEKYTNIELEQSAVEKFKERFSDDKFKNYEVLQKDLTNQDFMFETKYDAIVCMEVLEHLGKEAANKMLKVLYNNLDDEGIIIVSCPNPRKDEGQEFVWPEHHLYEFTYKEMDDMLKANNFENVNVLGWLGKARYMKPKFTETQEFLYNKFNAALNSGAATALLAILFPELAVGYMFICKKSKGLGALL
jgi:2-polyprenyl-3-methyl-5-hydroxy-6-metoxy-1,4-benzoquinol methylase